MEDDDDVVRPIRPNRGPGSRAGAGGRGGPRPRAARVRGWVVVLALPIILVIGALLNFWVDVLWFTELGQRDVVMTRIQWSSAMGLGTGLLAFAALLVNFTVARRVARDDLYVPFLTAGVNPEAPDQPTVPHFVMRPVLLAVAVVGGIIVGLVMSSKWETVLRFLGRSDFGVEDPQFHRDASFYVFTMPLLELIGNFLQAVVILCIVLVVIAYVAMGVIRYVPAPRIARAGTFHLSILAACFLVVSAFDYRLAIWDLVSSSRGVVTGAGWTEVHARMPGLWVLVVASLALAGVIVAYARRERWRVVGGAVVGWIALSVLASGLVPSLVQQVLVEPNELDREQHVLAGNVKLTRAAYGLTDVGRSEFRDAGKLTEGELLRDNTGTTGNLRLWSPDVLAQVLEQEQALRAYYTLQHVDVDRYDVDGKYTQVMLSVRELDQSKVGDAWTNRRLLFTHGYGAVATWPNRVTREGKPDLLLADFPPKADGQHTIKLTRPEVYFGELPSDFVVVNGKQEEFDYPEGEKNRQTRYEGEGGIPVRNFARRAAFAASLRDPRLLFTGQVTPKSRIMLRRDITSRITELAPFLKLDHDPYSVISDGRLFWVQDAYTTSDRFPYAEFTQDISDGSRINYVRNSVKAVVDAYGGDVTLYIADDKDPILRSWRKIFPDLFTPMSKMPADLRKHLRYPEDLFNIQTTQWQRYHMSNITTFYLNEDRWEAPQIGGAAMEGFYILARMPGEDGTGDGKEELLLVRPMVPKGKKNMIAYMVARSDGRKYGQLSTLDLGKQSLTKGPQQVQALVKQDPEIAEKVALWKNGGNVPTFGNLLVLPIGKSLLYVQPVYLQNSEAAIPEFQKIVVALGDNVAWGDDYEEAIRELLRKQALGQDGLGDGAGGEPSGDAGTGSGDGGSGTGTATGTGTGTGTGTDRPGTPPTDINPDAFADLTPEQLLEALAAIDSHYERAIECQKAGDWACYGRELTAIDDALAAARASGQGRAGAGSAGGDVVAKGGSAGAK